MKQETALRILGGLLDWDDDRAEKEYRWLRMMARMKYDGYRDFLAGARFLERLVVWLGQFDYVSEREVAFEFIKTRMAYVSTAEIVRVVEAFYWEVVQPEIVRKVSEQLSIPHYYIWTDAKAMDAFEREKRKTLFMGLSDGARLDVLRRFNQGVLINDQIVLQTQVDVEKWRSLLHDLRSDLRDDEARFSQVYLIDDFTASGTTLIRRENDEWRGKLPKFGASLDAAESQLEEKITTPDVKCHVHHYLATSYAANAIRHSVDEMGSDDMRNSWKQALNVTFGYIFPAEFPLSSPLDSGILSVNERYFDESLNDNPNLGASGVYDCIRGYAGCSLPLILEHNTPNNTIPIVWAETEGKAGRHAMRPLFRRRQRHS